MLKYKHVIWDWNGTLLDDLDICIESMNAILKKRDLDLIDKNKYMAVFSFPVKDYYLKLGFDFSKEPFEAISNDFTSNYEQRCFSCSLHSHAKEVLEAINAAGITQSILTAAHQDYIKKCINYYGIEGYFIKVLGLDNTHAHGKIENGKKLIAQLPYSPDEIVLIGDTEHDYEVAREIGCKCILLASGHHSIERLRSKDATVVDSIDSVTKILL